ncbi:ABC transporter permease family protein [Paludisphaera rhizosphaerae]|uniref:hypothetical protein n=1 Tax=Paludisphaera rhizosphaerae TaxID=2711216 RepID=UPI0013EABBAF|nr:hypothetical protein [Paludisphaera rhizosphaerae]
MIRRVEGWFSSIALGVLAVGPLAALGVCALTDIGPGGDSRASLFPAAVLVLDPFVWTCFRDSAAVAGLAALAAVLGGVFVGRLIGESGGPIREAAVLMLTALAVSPPTVLALATASVIDASPEGRPQLPASLGQSRFLPADPGWPAWLLAAALPGVAAGALSYAAALGRLDPSWRDAARLAGGAGARGWKRLAWPLLRPTMGRTAAVVFAWTLADPGPPLILGLRRTLGSQIVLAAVGEDPFPGLAFLGLLAVAACAVVRAGLRVWSGPDRLEPANGGSDLQIRREPAPSRVLAPAAILFTCSLLILAVVIGVGRGMKGITEASASRGTTIGAVLADPTVRHVLSRSLILGLGAALLAAVAGRLLERFAATAGAAASGRFRRLSRLLAPPPLVAGIIVPALARLIRLSAASGLIAPSPALAELAAWLDGDRVPLAAAMLAVAAAMIVARLEDRPPRTSEANRGAALDAAVLAGAGRRRARRLALGTAFGAGWRGLAADAAMASACIAPAVLLLASPQTATIGPAVLLFHERPDGGAAIAAFLAVVAWVLSVASAMIRPNPRRIASTIEGAGA